MFLNIDTVKPETLTDLANMNEFAKSMYPNKCLFYEDVKQFVNAVAVRIHQNFSLPNFLVLQ